MEKEGRDPKLKYLRDLITSFILLIMSAILLYLRNAVVLIKGNKYEHPEKLKTEITQMVSQSM